MMQEKRHPFKVQNRPIDFNVTVQKNPTLATIQELPLAKFWSSIKRFPQLPKKTIKILLLLQLHILCEARLPSYTSTKMAYCHRLNAEADMRIHLSPAKPFIKEICKNVKQCHSSHQPLCCKMSSF